MWMPVLFSCSFIFLVFVINFCVSKNTSQNSKNDTSDDSGNESSSESNLSESSFDPKADDEIAFKEYNDHMKKTADKPDHHKNRYILEYLDKYTGILRRDNIGKKKIVGLDVGGASGNCCMSLLNHCNDTDQIDRFIVLELEEKFRAVFEEQKQIILDPSLHEKISFFNANAVDRESILELPCLDCLLFNSVTHELISYASDYNADIFLDGAYQNWLQKLNKNGLLFIRDFMALDTINNKVLSNITCITIYCKTIQATNFLNTFFNDWKKGGKRQAIYYQQISKDEYEFYDHNSLLEVLLSFRWGHLNQNQYDGIIAEQFLNYTPRKIVSVTEEKGYELINKKSYLSQHYLQCWLDNFDFGQHTPIINTYYTSKTCLVFKKL